MVRSGDSKRAYNAVVWREEGRRVFWMHYPRLKTDSENARLRLAFVLSRLSRIAFRRAVRLVCERRCECFPPVSAIIYLSYPDVRGMMGGISLR
jgi:hypothetical protein